MKKRHHPNGGVRGGKHHCPNGGRETATPLQRTIEESNSIAGKISLSTNFSIFIYMYRFGKWLIIYVFAQVHTSSLIKRNTNRLFPTRPPDGPTEGDKRWATSGASLHAKTAVCAELACGWSLRVWFPRAVSVVSGYNTNVNGRRCAGGFVRLTREVPGCCRVAVLKKKEVWRVQCVKRCCGGLFGTN